MERVNVAVPAKMKRHSLLESGAKKSAQVRTFTRRSKIQTLISTPDGPHFHTSLSKSTGCYRQCVEQWKGAMKEAYVKAMKNNGKSATAGKNTTSSWRSRAGPKSF